MGRVLFSDDFNGPLDPGKWSVNTSYPNAPSGNPAYLGLTYMRQSLPSASGGVARIQLDTWNFDWQDGKSFFGSEAITRQGWDAQSNGGVAFQANLQFLNVPGGMIAGFFFYQQFPPPSKDAPRSPHNELDFEVFTSSLQAAKPISTNVYTHDGGGDGDLNYPISYPGPSPLEWHTYRIEWLPNKVTWLIDGNPIRTETETGRLPQPAVPQQLHLNLWGVPTNWGPSPGDPGGPPIGNPGFVPAGNQSQNATYFFNVAKVLVETLS
jgi:beta-glucanase (GH16 family)